MANDPQTPARRGPKAGTPEAQKGGQSVKAKYGNTFYSEIGRKGGTRVRDSRGPEYYATIGRKGGETTKRTKGVEHYARIGRIGGAARKNGAPEGEGDNAKA